MFERFTERSRQVVVLAQENARAQKHGFIGTEHVLLGLLQEEHGIAAQALVALGVTRDRVVAQVVRINGKGEEDPPPQIPFTPRAKKVLELALREALALGHNYIGTEHILLALTRENEGVAKRILMDLDTESEQIRNEVIRLLSGKQKSKPDRTWQPATSVGVPDVEAAEKLNKVILELGYMGELVWAYLGKRVVITRSGDGLNTRFEVLA